MPNRGGGDLTQGLEAYLGSIWPHPRILLFETRNQEQGIEQN